MSTRKTPRKAYCSEKCKVEGRHKASNDFWSMVDRSGGPDACWPWLGKTDRNGYGFFSENGEHVLAHRRAYELMHGRIPDGEGYHGTVIRHSCDFPPCCNTSHHVPGTQADNGRDMAVRGRAVTKLTPGQVLAIRADTRKYDDICAEYGISLGTVSEIKNRKIWKHI